MDILKIIAAVVFLAIAVFAVNYALTRPCEIGPITQTTDGQTKPVEVNQPAQMNRMICLSTDPYALLAVLIGTAAVFPAMTGLFKGITENREEKK